MAAKQCARREANLIAARRAQSDGRAAGSRISEIGRHEFR